MIKPVVFTDLDDTLFQTARKISGPVDGLRRGSRAVNTAHSYLTAEQDAFFEWLSATTRLIPVTARSSETINRCELPFRDYVVVSNGAVIFDPHGRVVCEWRERTAEISSRYAAALQELQDAVTKLNADNTYRHWIVEEDGMPIYYCVKSNGDEQRLDDVYQALHIASGLTEGFLLHRNGNNLSFTPEEISKKAAVDFLISKIVQGGQPVLGMGDSLTDLAFMQSCQMMVVPRHSQLAESLAAERRHA